MIIEAKINRRGEIQKGQNHVVNLIFIHVHEAPVPAVCQA
jgi:hypothetical protein